MTGLNPNLEKVCNDYTEQYGHPPENATYLIHYARSIGINTITYGQANSYLVQYNNNNNYNYNYNYNNKRGGSMTNINITTNDNNNNNNNQIEKKGGKKFIIQTEGSEDKGNIRAHSETELLTRFKAQLEKEKIITTTTTTTPTSKDNNNNNNNNNMSPVSPFSPFPKSKLKGSTSTVSSPISPVPNLTSTLTPTITTTTTTTAAATVTTPTSGLDDTNNNNNNNNNNKQNTISSKKKTNPRIALWEQKISQSSAASTPTSTSTSTVVTPTHRKNNNSPITVISPSKQDSYPLPISDHTQELQNITSDPLESNPTIINQGEKEKEKKEKEEVVESEKFTTSNAIAIETNSEINAPTRQGITETTTSDSREKDDKSIQIFSNTPFSSSLPQTIENSESTFIKQTINSEKDTKESMPTPHNLNNQSKEDIPHEAIQDNTLMPSSSPPASVAANEEEIVTDFDVKLDTSTTTTANIGHSDVDTGSESQGSPQPISTFDDVTKELEKELQHMNGSTNAKLSIIYDGTRNSDGEHTIEQESNEKSIKTKEREEEEEEEENEARGEEEGERREESQESQETQPIPKIEIGKISRSDGHRHSITETTKKVEKPKVIIKSEVKPTRTSTVGAKLSSPSTPPISKGKTVSPIQKGKATPPVQKGKATPPVQKGKVTPPVPQKSLPKTQIKGNSKPTTGVSVKTSKPTVVVEKKIQGKATPQKENKSSINTSKARPITRTPQKKVETSRTKSFEGIRNTTSEVECFMIRCNLEAKGQEGFEMIRQCLEIMYQHQIDSEYVGTMIYHFTRPQPETRPYYIELIELYQNEKVFLKHSNSKLIAKAYSKAFTEDNIRTNDTYVLWNDNINTKVQAISSNIRTACDHLHAQYLHNEFGYVCHNQYQQCMDFSDNSRILLKFGMNIESDKRQKFITIWDELSKFAYTSQAIVFNGYCISTQNSINVWECINVWPSDVCLNRFMEESKVAGLFHTMKQELWNNSIEEETKINDEINSNGLEDFKFNKKCYCEVYTETALDEPIKEKLQSLLLTGNEKMQIRYSTTELGYILHPDAKPSTLKSS